LSLIENDNVIVWRCLGTNSFIAEMVNVLDEWLYALADGALAFEPSTPDQLIAH
jgi:hypothetical protein